MKQIEPNDPYHEPPEPCFMIEGEWSDDAEEKNERTMGREISSENT